MTRQIIILMPILTTKHDISVEQCVKIHMNIVIQLMIEKGHFEFYFLV